MPDFCPQLIEGEGLLEKTDIVVDDAVMGDYLRGVPGSEQDPQVRFTLLELLLEFAAVHLGHDDIRNEQLDFAQYPLKISYIFDRNNCKLFVNNEK